MSCHRPIDDSFASVLAPDALSPRARNLAAASIHRIWRWISVVGSVGPADARGRAFRSMGASSCLAFPPGAVFGEHWIEIGSGTLVGPHVSLAVGMPDEPIDPCGPPVITIGDRCSIGRGSAIVGRCRIAIADDVTIGPDVYITDHNHTYADVDVPIGRQWPAEDPVSIGPGSWLGAGVIVLPGAQIGRHVVAAAGSVVRGHIPDRAVIAGAPARVVRRHLDGDGWVPPIPPQVIRAPEGWIPG
jgi:carbonic anhydrase/acetyltransferase-like protein (isoleucine patch superfamily)